MMRIIVAFILSFLSFAASAQTTQILGAPNTRIATKGDMSVDSIFYLPRTLVTSRSPIQAGALRYQSSDSALYQWTGTAWRKAGGGDVDTLLLSTRAWRQKGIDSLASVRIGGSGITGYIPKFTAARTLDSSQIFQLGGNIGIGTATPSSLYKVDVNGSIRSTSATFETASSSFLIRPNFSALGEIPAGILLSSANTNSNITIIPEQDNGTAGRKVVIAAFGGGGTGWKSVMETENVSSGNPNLNLVRNAGNVVVGASTTGSYKVDITGNVRSTTDAYFATTSGNVGVGLTSPDAIFHVSKSNAGGLGGQIVIDNPSTSTLGSFTEISFLNNSGGSGSGSRNAKIVSRLENASTGESNFGFFTWNGTSENERLRIFGNGRIGVNTTTDAGYQFDVAGSMRNTTGAAFATSSGNVGIGTASPASKLDVVGVINSSGEYWLGNYNFSRVAILDANGGFSGGYNFTMSGTTPKAAVTGASSSGYYYSGSTVRFYANNSQTAGTNLTERLRIDATGVGIGTSSPSYLLDVAGNIRSTTDAYFNTSSGETYIGTTSDAGAFRLQVNGVAYAVDGLRTGNPTGGTAATWKLGTVASVSPTSPNRTIEVDIGGTIYYIHAKTTND